jgi:hypothetical protein
MVSGVFIVNFCVAEARFTTEAQRVHRVHREGENKEQNLLLFPYSVFLCAPSAPLW